MTVSAGLDVHKRKCHGVIVDEDGEVLKDEEFDNSLLGVKSFFQDFHHANMDVKFLKTEGKCEFLDFD